MTYENLGMRALDYSPCRYGRSKLLFRGPQCRLDDRYIAVLGGSETYGRFMEKPYPALLQELGGVETANFGCVNAGVDAYMNDTSILEICAGAAATVIQITGAHNLSNRCYAVHPRRNDRFLRASTLLRTLYPEVDFTDVHFTRHLLTRLASECERNFEMLVEELRTAWVARMCQLLSRLPGPTILLWLADHAPGEVPGTALPLRAEPLFVDRAMLDAVAAHASGLVEIVATPEERAAGLSKMVYSEMEGAIADEMLGPVVHRRAAQQVAASLEAIRAI